MSVKGLTKPSYVPGIPGGSKKVYCERLSLEILEPICLANPTHHTKVVTSNIFSISEVCKSSNTYVFYKVDTLQIKKYWGY